MELQATVWYKQDRVEEARAEALRAVDVYEKLGAARDLERCRELLQRIEKKMKNPVASGQSDFNCEFPQIAPLPARIDFPF